MHDGRSHRVRTHRESTDGLGHTGTKACFFEHVEHNVADEWACFMMKSGPTHIHVVTRLPARGEGEISPLDC